MILQRPPRTPYPEVATDDAGLVIGRVEVDPSIVGRIDGRFPTGNVVDGGVDAETLGDSDGCASRS